MQEGSPPQRAAIVQRYGPFGGVEDELNPAITDGVDDMRAALGHLVDLLRLDALFNQIPLGSAGRNDAETERGQHPHRLKKARLVDVPPGHEHAALAGQPGAATDLAFGEGNREGM